MPVGRNLADLAGELLLEPGDAHHEELVEVRATIAWNLSRSRSGTVSFSASARTRALNSSQESSRFRYVA
jgi:hypothetical protein